MTEEQFNKYDVFRSFLVQNANYDGYIELPVIKTSDDLPKKNCNILKSYEKNIFRF